MGTSNASEIFFGSFPAGNNKIMTNDGKYIQYNIQRSIIIIMSIAAVDGSNVCQEAAATSILTHPLPPLPEIIRHDKDAYFEQRLGLSPLSPLLSPLLPSTSLTIGDNSTSPSTTTTTTSSSSQCRLYMAPSSVPNAGLGVFSGTHIPPDTLVDLNPQILLPIIDIRHFKPDAYGPSILQHYPWIGRSMGTHLESKYDATFAYPNLGMLCNSHLGLKNVRMDMKKTIVNRYSRIVDRSKNPGSGASSYFYGFSFGTYAEENGGAGIDAGEELFLVCFVNLFYMDFYLFARYLSVIYSYFIELIRITV